MTLCRKFLNALESQLGKPYVLGAEVRLDDPDPKAFDCSEYVQWGLYQAGVRRIKTPSSDLSIKAFDQAKWQYAHSRHISVKAGVATKGALLFIGKTPATITHVAVSTGDGKTIEARGRRYGVCRAKAFTASKLPRFQYASKIDELYREA